MAAGISFILALGVVTAIEHSAGKSLTCWAWEECPVETSTEEGGGASEDSTTRPSIFGGGPTSGRDAAALGVQPAGPQQQPTSPLGPPEASPSSQAPWQAMGSKGSAPGAGDQWQEQSDQQQDSYDYYSEEEYEQQSASSLSTAEEEQRREYQDGGAQDWGYEVPWVPWTT